MDRKQGDEANGDQAGLKAEIDRQGLEIPIEVDGGVSASNAAALVAAGAEILVAGSAVFKAESPKEIIEAMRG